jgi:hypothetical protein
LKVETVYCSKMVFVFIDNWWDSLRSCTKESPCGSPKQLNPLHHPSLCLQLRTQSFLPCCGVITAKLNKCCMRHLTAGVCSRAQFSVLVHMVSCWTAKLLWCAAGRSLCWCTVCLVNEQHVQWTYCGARQGAACIGAQRVLLMGSMYSELTVVWGRAQLVLVHSVSC